jgi:steroid delta-isomerase-like uncharacterized protein
MSRSNNLAAQHLTAWSGQNIDAVASLYADDGIYEDVAADRKAQGKEAIKAFMAQAFAAVPDFSVTLEKVVLGDTRLACEWVMTGTPVGTLDDLSATGKSFSVRGASIAELEGDKIKRWSDYYDRLLLLTQLETL